ncbi:MAG TPA: glycogen/starch synthase, partial [Candidatus Onthomorpha intestinigallinarum]|nr:glycogen/starch synthase [Candidatus Onthomorpha intestinigallinarum]
MFGWEYPPHISGGLGTACFGLTTALTKKGVDILFVVPKLFGDEYVSGARLLSAEQVSNALARMDISQIESVLSDLCNRISYVEIDSLLVPY